MKNPPNNHAHGMQGQHHAEALLRERGLHIIARNYRAKTGEIDLIAQHGTYTVFVEVKTRTSHTHGTPAEAVTYQKQQKIIRTAQSYLARYGICDCDVRFDVVEILMVDGKPYGKHIENAFWA
jgi:putative endonuclease